MHIPEWLITRPLAHRGLHDAESGIIENSLSAFEAAVTAGYAIETDVQRSRDGVPVMFHDHVLDRMTCAKGAIADYPARELKKIRFRGTSDKMVDLEEFLGIINGRAPLLIEIKSRKETGPEFPVRVAQILQKYQGPYALMSFDPRMMKVIRDQFPDILRGLATGGFTLEFWPEVSAFTRFKLRHFYYLMGVKPHFIAHDVNFITAPEPRLFRKLRGPVICWTIRTDEDEARARRYADNIVFEKRRP